VSATADTTAPTFSAELPRRLPATKTGTVAIPLSIRCDEALLDAIADALYVPAARAGLDTEDLFTTAG
jgi:hypothetical protein